MSAVAQRTETRDVIRMQMGVERLDEPHVELAHELQVTVDLVQHRIDDQRLAAASAGDQVGVGSGYAVEQLAKDHDSLQRQSSR